jgi:hypothetical protein
MMKQHNAISTALDDGKEDDLSIGWPKRESDASEAGERWSADRPEPRRSRAATGSRRWFGSWRFSSPDDWHMRHEECAAMVAFKETIPFRRIDAVIRAVRRGAQLARSSNERH